MKASALLMVAALIAGPASFQSAKAGEPDEQGFVRVAPDDLQWQDLRPGLSFAVLEGDPTSEGFYILRAGLRRAPSAGPIITQRIVSSRLSRVHGGPAPARSSTRHPKCP
ncbi:hypothetical protein JCM17846_18840 [Iodidimonas nitroreducens]|uniref:Uncharacterized protein n=1 Tax=Iodidimonas nitroreducens TaxID=1236968 RepID=A0A5A7N7A6_9PROT|nr:hypothetical protein [Iodidimonas nitroreducens]GER04202.1 hypothetical protein JCM17846_18840 [Iodidimonas nitroreducens]